MRGAAVEAYTSHWRSPLLEDADAVIVSVSRGQPRWRLPFRYKKLSALAPGDEAWREQSMGRFEAAYTRQLEELGAETILEDLLRISEEHGGKPLCLLCWERPHEPFCHRWTLARWLGEQTGMEVPELEAGMLAQRPDTPQQALF